MVFVFKTKIITHVKKSGPAVERTVIIFQKKRELGMRVRSHVKTLVLVSLRLIAKRSRYVPLTKPE